MVFTFHPLSKFLPDWQSATKIQLHSTECIIALLLGATIILIGSSDIPRISWKPYLPLVARRVACRLMKIIYLEKGLGTRLTIICTHM